MEKTSGKPAGFGPGGSDVGHCQRVGLLDHGHRRLPAPTDDGHDPVPGEVPADFGPDGHYLAGELQPGDVGRGAPGEVPGNGPPAGPCRRR